MLTQAHRQEALSRVYVQAVAAQAGLTWSKPEPDYGIDLSLRALNIEGHRRRDAGIQLDLQLKSTTWAALTATDVVFDLEVDAYNGLRDDQTACPRILVVFVMPANENQWLEQ